MPDSVAFQKLCGERLSRIPAALGDPLDRVVSCFAGDAGFVGQHRQDGFGENQAAGQLEIGFHPVGVDDELFKNSRHSGKDEVQQNGRIRQDDALGRGVAQNPFVQVVLEGESRLGISPQYSHQPRHAFGRNWVALVRHSRRAGLAGVEVFLRFPHFGGLHMADVIGDFLDRAADYGECGQVFRDNVAGDDLRRNHRFQAETLASSRLDFGVEREHADRAGKLPDGYPLLQVVQPHEMAKAFRVPVGQLHPEGDGFGVHQMRAADLRRVFVLQSAGFKRRHEAG